MAFGRVPYGNKRPLPKASPRVETTTQTEAVPHADPAPKVKFTLTGEMKAALRNNAAKPRSDGLPTGIPFQKGQPRPNRGGRPKGIAAIAREHADKAIYILVAALSAKEIRTRVMAAKELLDRGYGKAIAMTADVTDRLDDLDEADLTAALSAIRDTLGARAHDDTQAGLATSPNQIN